MELVSPGLGMIVWMTLIFGLLLLVLGRFAWKPIMKALREREQSIEDALNSADKARGEMKNLQLDNEKLVNEARKERDFLLREAKSLKNEIIEKARVEAAEEKYKIVKSARVEIINEKNAALVELKDKIAGISIDIAEKILEKELSNEKEQKKLIDKFLSDVKMN
ncbi:MAG: F0F1 ATP synthase subunit B [Bacteroidota bacterium]|nr:F0F1 ATP synthase subunit B [Bacteroidota bacterium]